MAGVHHSAEEWEELAAEAILDLLDQQGAVTVSEMEARISDRTFNSKIVPRGIDPHHLTTARNELRRSKAISPHTATTRGSPREIITWHLGAGGPSKAVSAIAARKRLLTARHDGWARRGAANRGLIGAAGELAVETALRDTPGYTSVSPSTMSVLDVDLTRLGEVDFSVGLYDISDPTDPVAITVMIEVKNTRHWHYPKDTERTDTGEPGELRRFLTKAAYVQAVRPNALICPVFTLRHASATLVSLGNDQGFGITSTDTQVVLADYEILANAHHFDEVRTELGYLDLKLLQRPNGPLTTSYHRGIIGKHIPKVARSIAERWRHNHQRYLP